MIEGDADGAAREEAERDEPVRILCERHAWPDGILHLLETPRFQLTFSSLLD
jgi:hypothetical protein